VRWTPVAVAVTLGAALLVVGSVQPLVRLSGIVVRPPPGTPNAEIYERFLRSFETSVVDLAFPPDVTVDIQVHDTYFIADQRAPSFPARLVLLWAAAAIALAATRRRILAGITCALLAGTIVWLFVQAGAELAPSQAPGAPAGWTAYPPLRVSASARTPLENSWPTWIALVLGTALLAASTFLRVRPVPDLSAEAAPQPPPLP